MTTKARYDIYINSPFTGIVHCADCVIAEQQYTVTQVGFRYRDHYLQLPNAFALDPEQLPLQTGEFTFQCQGAIPAFLDDYLPDSWGRKVLSRVAFYQKKLHYNANSVIDSLSLLSHSRIGALAIVPHGETPQFEQGHSLATLKQAEQAAQHLDEGDYAAIDHNEMNLIYLANTGTGVGGARPKALLFDQQQPFIAKFNRHSLDSYNNARVELACLLMAKAAGLNVGKGKVQSDINNREVLLLERFDINPQGQRHHLITINGLLKEKQSQRNYGGSFRYDNIYQLLCKHSTTIEQDLQQLLALMLFNRAINNTDDHERNFSLINKGEGYQLAPAYDLVPSVATGQYHAAGFAYQPYPPRPSETAKLGKIFGLSKTTVKHITEQITEAIKNWHRYAEQAGVNETDTQRINKHLRP